MERTRGRTGSGRRYADGRAPGAVVSRGMRCVYMPLPRMDVNATEVRRRWLEGRCLNVLVPDAELALMRKHDALLREIWG